MRRPRNTCLPVLMPALASLVLLSACSKAPEANPEFSDVARFLLTEFDSDSEADLAYAMRQLEEQVYLAVDVQAADFRDRTLEQSRLSPSDVDYLDVPPVPADRAVPVSVARASVHPVDDHVRIQLLPDQTPVEVNSPDHYVRTFLDGTDECFSDRSCDFLRTDNDLIRQNLVLRIPYQQFKDFRWVDMNLPDPDSVPAGTQPINDGEARWAVLARTWITEEFVGEEGNNVLQLSWTIEFFLPRDDGGCLRMMAYWTLVDGYSEQVIRSTSEEGINAIFEAGDVWIEENSR